MTESRIMNFFAPLQTPGVVYKRNPWRGRLALLGAAAILPLAAAAPASADPSNALLISILEQKGILSPTQAKEILAEADAASSTPAPAPAPAPAAPALAPVASVASDGSIDVHYVPQFVQDKIAQQVKTAVMAQAQSQNWAAPNEVPDWVQRIHISGDMRVRYEGNLYPSGNDNTGSFVNFNAINTGSPYNVPTASSATQTLPPLYDVNQDRNYFRLRGRLAVDADLGDGWYAGLRIGTGQDDSPVSQNQTLGFANNGQGGNFSKYAIWLDRGYITYRGSPISGLNTEIDFGRFDNPFFTTPLIWADDIGFDGFAAKASYTLGDGITPFITGGAFPIFDSVLNFSSDQSTTEFSSENKYLFAAQAGANWQINDDYANKFGAALYDFEGITGKLSAPCIVVSASDTCSTDELRPSFAQKGNSYMALRDIIPTSANDEGTINQFQYFGLVSRFRELAITDRFDISAFDPTHLWINAEFVDNLGFDRARLNQLSVNNRKGTPAGGTETGSFAGGNLGYYVSFSAGHPVLEKRGDWNVTASYRYIESDATVDAFNDPDFGLGGTDVKGYTIGGNIALSPRVWASLRYMAADQVTPDPFSVDVVLSDLNAKF